MGLDVVNQLALPSLCRIENDATTIRSIGNRSHNRVVALRFKPVAHHSITLGAKLSYRTNACCRPASSMEELSAKVCSAVSVAASMCNLLSVGGDSQSTKLPGLNVGESLPPVQVKLAKRIHKW